MPRAGVAKGHLMSSRTEQTQLRLPALFARIHCRPALAWHCKASSCSPMAQKSEAKSEFIVDSRSRVYDVA